MTQPTPSSNNAEPRPKYADIYTADYYSGKDSFFYKISGGYKDFRPYFNRLARWFMPHVQGPNILDVGCAYGYMLERFVGYGNLHGIDVSAHAIAVARRRLPQAQLHVGTLGVDPIPYADATFQTVLMTDVIEHLVYDDQPAAAAEIRRVLQPGGHWLITTPNLSLVRRVFYRIPDRMEHHFGMRDHRGWLAFFAGQGFEVVDWWTYLHGMLPFRWRRGLLPEFAVVLRRLPA